MENKIYEKLTEDHAKNMNKLIKMSGDRINKEDLIKGMTPTKNIDLDILLTRLGLIKQDYENLEILNEFHEYLTKYSIKLGVSHGKRMRINQIQNGNLSFESLMKINTEDYGKHFSSVPIRHEWR